MFVNREVHKEYTALLAGQLRGAPEGKIDVSIDGRPALTNWLLQRVSYPPAGPVSTVTLRPHTGRKHQLRRFNS